ncbi:MAG: Ig-like domain-containing protein, partial [Verrucomicrobiota bacterium]
MKIEDPIPLRWFFTLLGGLLTVLPCPATEVSRITPGAYALNQALNTGIEVRFNGGVNASTVQSSTFTVRGEWHGIYAGTYTFPRSSRVFFTPAQNYLPGERIEVSISSGLLDGSNQPVQPYTFFFYAAASGCPDPNFIQLVDAPGQTDNHATVLGDLDGDGDLDAVIQNLTQP